MKSGLVSVSFRSLSCERIIEIAKGAGLSGVEWGGDVHVPHGDVDRASRVGKLTRAAGLDVAAYGSYYRVGTYGNAYPEVFRRVLASAVAFGAPMIRLWAGETGSGETPEEKRAAMVNETKDIAAMAAQQGIALAFECHNGTLTDRADSFVRLMWEIGLPNVKMYWQPNERLDFAGNLASLEACLPYLANVHVFHWPSPGLRLPLAEGEPVWRQYIRRIAACPGERYLMLEFMPGDTPAELPEEAAVLHRWLSE